MKTYDVIIVGASFAGLSCAKSLLEKNKKVLIIEAKKDLNHRIHTTGIIVEEAFKEWSPGSQYIRPINKVILYSPNLTSIELSSQKYAFYTTDTGAMLQDKAKELEKQGVDFLWGTPFKGANKNESMIEILELGVRAFYLVGADGSRSKVARHFNLETNKRFLHGFFLTPYILWTVFSSLYELC